MQVKLTGSRDIDVCFLRRYQVPQLTSNNSSLGKFEMRDRTAYGSSCTKLRLGDYYFANKKYQRTIFFFGGIYINYIGYLETYLMQLSLPWSLPDVEQRLTQELL